MENNNNLEARVSEIERRNERVEADKRWETSLIRKSAIAILTYLVMISFMASIGVTKPWLNAVIPTLGFLLSTLSLRLIKSLWQGNDRT